MCIAIYKPAEAPPQWGHYENGYDSNKDGWGFAAVVDGQLEVRVGLGDFQQFKEYFAPYADKQAIIHFRWATHGSVDCDNCHPFMVADNLAVIHNGIVDIDCNVNSDRSDTWHLNELVFKPMLKDDPDFFIKPHQQFVHEQATKGSKFVFLRADGTRSIWGVNSGHWEDDGHWYSNMDYKWGRRLWGFWNKDKATSTSIAVSRHDSDSATATDVEVYDDEDRADMAKWEREAAVEAEAQQAYSRYYESLGSDDDEDESLDVLKRKLWEMGLQNQTIDDVEEVLGKSALESLCDLL